MASKATSRRVSNVFAAFESAMFDYCLKEHVALRHADLGARAIADYVAGMTDRYAIREYRRLFSIDVT